MMSVRRALGFLVASDVRVALHAQGGDAVAGLVRVLVIVSGLLVGWIEVEGP